MLTDKLPGRVIPASGPSDVAEAHVFIHFLYSQQPTQSPAWSHLGPHVWLGRHPPVKRAQFPGREPKPAFAAGHSVDGVGGL